jgi:hydrogenase nickel incorporation protein HypA/HybF
MLEAEMHEVGIAQGILAVVLDAAEGHPVQTVKLRVGALQAIEQESLQLGFQVASLDTLAADAVLEVKEVTPRIDCHRCECELEVDLPQMGCPRCGGFDLEIIAGDELSVDAVERDDGWFERPDLPLEESPTHSQIADDAGL